MKRSRQFIQLLLIIFVIISLIKSLEILKQIRSLSYVSLLSATNFTLPFSISDSYKTNKVNTDTPIISDDDGCGLFQSNPQWTSYSKSHFTRLTSLKLCKERLLSSSRDGASEAMNWRNGVNLTYLKCNDHPDVTILKEFDTIYMIGDSLLRQQYFVLICMLNISSDIEVMKSPEKVEYRSTIQWSDKNSLTTILYIPSGPLFTQKPLYEEEFPRAVATGTARDVIIMNAGHHYSSETASMLLDDVKHIVETARNHPIHVYFMETTDEQWPTSNGMYPTFGNECCCEKCICEVWNDDKILGRVKLKPDLYNFSAAFGRLYPDQSILDPLFDPNHRLNHTHCVPDCYPANWKNILIRSILLQNQSNVHLVPLWHQLVSRGLLNSVTSTDCTHQAVDVLIEVNLQLLRSINSKSKKQGMVLL
jgi:hypothetical protein